VTELADMRRAYETIEGPNEETVAAARDVLLAAIEEAIGREQVARQRTRRRQRFIVVAVAALVLVVGTASAFGTVRDFFFGASGTVVRGAHAWSPDGSSIAFVAYRPGGPPEVYIMDASGTRPQRNLTRQWGRSVVPIWSPDWQKVAFVSDPCAAVKGACSRTRQIYVMNADGSGLRRVARGGKVRRLDSGQGVCPCAPAPTWSPDGRKIAFGRERDGSVEIYLMNADGSGQRRLTRNDAAEGSLAWSPGGRWIAFVSGVNDGMGPPRRQEIYVMNADGSGQRLLARGHAPAWSPNGRRIAFRSDRDGNGEIYVVNFDGSGLRRLTRDPASDGGPVWSPKGGTIAFERFRNGNTDIWVMNADGSTQRNLTPEARPPRRARDSGPAWSPDGRRIAFTTERDGNGEIYVMNADGSGQQNLTRLKGERFSRSVGNISFSFSVPGGWHPGPLGSSTGKRRTGGLYVSQDIVGGQAAEAVVFWTGFPRGGYALPCPSLLRRLVGPSSADLANAVATAPGTELISGPASVTLGGRPAKHVVLAVREDVGCDPGFFFTWIDEMWGPFWPGTYAGDVIKVWIVEIEGTHLVIEAETKQPESVSPPLGLSTRPTRADVRNVDREIASIVGSIRFD
jgi:Tol biopolymer transport system component